MPASGPTPGSTPPRVPTTQPTKAYRRTVGWSATEHEQHQREQDGEVTGTRVVPGAEGQPAALPHDEHGKQAERDSTKSVRGQHG